MIRIYLDWLRERYESAKGDARESHKVAMNSYDGGYGAGYDQGYVDALQEAMKHLEEPEQ